MPLLLVTPPRVEPVSLAEAKNHLRADSDLTADDFLITQLISSARRFAEAQTARSFISRSYRLVADSFPNPMMLSPYYGEVFSWPPNAFKLDRGEVQQVSSVRYQDMSGAWQTVDPTLYVAETSGMPARVAPGFGKVWPPSLPQLGAVTVDYLAGCACGVSFNQDAGTFTPDLWPPLIVGTPVQFSLSGDATAALPAPLVAGTTYYVQAIPQAGTYTLAATAGGAAIALTSAGVGQFYFGTVPEGIRHWMLLRIGSVYKHREEAAAMARGKIEVLPWVDFLLDPYRVELA